MIRIKTLDEMPETLLGVPAEEKETIIRKDYPSKATKASERVAHICTTDATEYTKLMKMCRSNPDKWRALGYDVCCSQPQTAYFECPARLVSYRAGLEMDPGRKAALAERMRTIGKGNAASGSDSDDAE